MTEAVTTPKLSTNRESRAAASLYETAAAAVRAHPVMAVVLAAIAWAIVETWPVVTQLNVTIFGTPGDATGTVGLYWWWAYAARHGLSLFDNTLQGVPLGSGWETIPFSVLPMAIFTPLALAFGPIVAYNLELLSSFPLTAWTTYLLGRRMQLPALAAAFAGLAFAAVPFHIQKAMGHAGQTHMELFPAALLFLVRWRQGGSRWNLAAAGAVAGLQLWIDFYFTAILVLLVAIFFLVSGVMSDSRWPTWASQLRGQIAAGAIVLLVAGAFLPLAVVFAHRPSSADYVGTAQQAATPVIRTEGEVALYSARLQFYVTPPHDNPLVPGAVSNWETAHLHGNNFVEASLFIGYTVIVLALLAVLVRRLQFPNRGVTASRSIRGAVRPPRDAQPTNRQTRQKQKQKPTLPGPRAVALPLPRRAAHSRVLAVRCPRPAGSRASRRFRLRGHSRARSLAAAARRSRPSIRAGCSGVQQCAAGPCHTDTPGASGVQLAAWPAAWGPRRVPAGWA